MSQCLELTLRCDLNILISAKKLLLLFFFGYIGWKWSPADRPSFAETHQAFETMFHDSSISEGENLVIYCWWGLVLGAGDDNISKIIVSYNLGLHFRILN